MAGGITEEAAGESQFTAGLRVDGCDALDPPAVPLDRKGMHVEEEIDRGLGTDDLLLFGVAKLLVGAGALFRVIAELVNDLADPRILAPADQPHRPDPNLARTVAAEHGPILNERNLESHACRRQAGPHAGIAAANHDQIIGAFDLRLRRETERPAAPGREGFGLVRWRRIGRQHDAVAAAVETG